MTDPSPADIVPIRRALISVSDKTGLLALGEALVRHGAELLSTGGSARALREAGVPVVEVSEHTGFPEILDGRVKTLVPQIHGGILARRDLPEHRAQMAEHGIAPIDLVCVNLYPFEATVAAGAAAEDCIENIDIGGPALIRAAAKNHADVAILTEPAQYQAVIDALASSGGTSLASTAQPQPAQGLQQVTRCINPSAQITDLSLLLPRPWYLQGRQPAESYPPKKTNQAASALLCIYHDAHKVPESCCYSILHAQGVGCATCFSLQAIPGARCLGAAAGAARGLRAAALRVRREGAQLAPHLVVGRGWPDVVALALPATSSPVL